MRHHPLLDDAAFLVLVKHVERCADAQFAGDFVIYRASLVPSYSARHSCFAFCRRCRAL